MGAIWFDLFIGPPMGFRSSSLAKNDVTIAGLKMLLADFVDFFLEVGIVYRKPWEPWKLHRLFC
jgi:hypothetical protein